MVMRLGYCVMMEHGRDVGGQRAPLQGRYDVFHGFRALCGLSGHFGHIIFHYCRSRSHEQSSDNCKLERSRGRYKYT